MNTEPIELARITVENGTPEEAEEIIAAFSSDWPDIYAFAVTRNEDGISTVQITLADNESQEGTK